MPMPRISVTATKKVDLGDTGPHTVGSFMLHISNTFVGSIVTKGYMRGGGLGVNDAVAIAYKPMKTGVITDPTVTAITTPGTYEVITDGLNLVLDITYTSGTIDIDAQPLRG